ncbi:uncharacterized protein LOC113307715 [Papaver somniferum]|uniref:uncharacterized protein LOC113307715 n=1 Tax=Papaver somniferum TaxID=3469 RepID=UPI000E6FB6EB|nr:uncharacterized protein LOC113307715 [Papaver somniferum]
MKFLKSFHNAGVLKLSPGIVEVISGPELVSEPSQLCNLRRLKLQLWLTRGSLCALQVLFTMAPSIESLHLSIHSNSLDKVEDWDAAGLSFSTMFQHLKLIKVRGAVRCSNELVLLESLLRNAPVLEQLIVFTCDIDSNDNQLKDFNEKILGLPRASQSIRISISSLS